MKKLPALAAFVVSVLATGSAWASYHATKIVQVFAGAPSAPGASYVQLQAYAPGQNYLGGHSLVVYDAAGTVTATIPLADVVNGNDQANVLIATSQFQAAFGVAPDFATLPTLPGAGGMVCFEPSASIDCFAWGAYTGDHTTTGTPFAALTQGKAAVLTIDGGDDPLLFDANDDTNDSAADFAAAAPLPTNNQNQSGALPDAGTPPIDTDSGTELPPPSDAGPTKDPTVTPPVVGTDAGTNGAAPSSSEGGCNTTGGSVSWLGLVAALTCVGAMRRRRGSVR